ncbi:exported hypothetical protein [Mesorhizobium delmotii]|uniref:Uncharacterized protein n=1 Tax=Mesorhizobium delmotii TaxID=1631247 RepID=A0A2P9AC86_9HYPH|nr:exported hypothetical protein [Mesorhizobium delmotii]
MATRSARTSATAMCATPTASATISLPAATTSWWWRWSGRRQKSISSRFTTRREQESEPRSAHAQNEAAARHGVRLARHGDIGRRLLGTRDDALRLEVAIRAEKPAPISTELESVRQIENRSRVTEDNILFTFPETCLAFPLESTRSRLFFYDEGTICK